MKNIVTIIVSLLITLPFFAQNKPLNNGNGVLFEEGTLAQALAKAKNNKKGPKIVFLDCYTTWCGPCKYMSNNIFPQEKVGTFFNSNFVNIKIDMEKGEGIELAKKYQVRAYPTFLILDSDGNEINRLVGGGEADAFIEKVKKAMDPANSPKNLRAKYDSDKSLNSAIQYLEALQASYMTKVADDFVDEIFVAMQPNDRYSDKLWPYISKSLQNTDSNVFEIVMSEKPVADRWLSKERVDLAICNGVKNLALNYVNGKIKDADHGAVMAKVAYLNFLSTKDVTASYFVKSVKYFGENNFDAIGGMLNVNELMKMGDSDRNSIERLLITTKGMPKEKTLEYYKAKQEYLRKQADMLNANIERLSK